MKKCFITILLVIATVFVFTPVNTRALSISDTVYSSVYILDDDTDLFDDVEQEQRCDGSQNSLLGDPDDPNSVAWLLQKVLNFIKVVGPLIVIVLSSVDFIQVIIKSDDEAMAKAQKKLITRLVLAALLFFIPVLVQVILDIFGFTSSSTCGLK